MLMHNQKLPTGIWKEDWRARIRNRLANQGCASLMAFAEARPGASPQELANEIGNDEASSTQFKWLFIEEAMTSPYHYLIVHLLDLLRRCLREAETSWFADTEKERRTRAREAILGWAGAMHHPLYITPTISIATHIVEEIESLTDWRQILRSNRLGEISSALWPSSPDPPPAMR